MFQQQALAPLIGISNLARHLKAQNRIVNLQMWAFQELSTFASGVATSVQAAAVLLHVLHALIRTIVVPWSALNLSRNQYRSVA